MSNLPSFKNVVCIAGPTASGKSAYAIDVAKARDGEIINADSMQVYTDLRVLSARPSAGEMEGIPHHLFGHVDGATRYSTGHWIREIQPAINDCHARGKTPIIVGGTGLYFRALTIGLAHVPKPSGEGMAQTHALAESGIDALRRKAEQLDPAAAARVLGNDPQRLIRIVSVALGTNKILSDWQANTKPILAKDEWEGKILLPDRQNLYERINCRFDEMTENGGLEEAKKVLEKGLHPNLPMMKAIGLPPLISYLKGELSYEAALFEAKRDTRRFAKRQFTWWRSHSEGWVCKSIS